jgi:enamine deaminase RidA (YjgF/YER057c/UK114 family)
MSAEQRLKSLGITLPVLTDPIGDYVPFKRAGDMVYLSGRGPRSPDGKPMTGKVGQNVSTDEAYARARIVGVGLLAAARQAAGSLDKVEIIKVLGLVNATPDFKEQARVIDGCSDLFVEVLGERGRHARSAVGIASLPLDMTVEVEAIVRIVEPAS